MFKHIFYGLEDGFDDDPVINDFIETEEVQEEITEDNEIEDEYDENEGEIIEDGGTDEVLDEEDVVLTTESYILKHFGMSKETSDEIVEQAVDEFESEPEVFLSENDDEEVDPDVVAGIVIGKDEEDEVEETSLESIINDMCYKY